MKKALATLFFTVLIAACSHREDAAVPKPYAYPRVAQLDTIYEPAQVGNMSFDINADADTICPRPDWLNIAYPTYGATLHISVVDFRNAEDLDAAVANRRQRISLNIADAPAQQTEFINRQGLYCLLVEAPDAATTPLQFIAADTREGSLLSGAAVFQGSTTPVDSLAPILKALKGDILKLLWSVSPE